MVERKYVIWRTRQKLFFVASLIACYTCQVISFSYLDPMARGRKTQMLQTTRDVDLEYSSGSYNFWEEPMTAANFNMDLQNLATEDARRAQDALEIMEEKYKQQQQDMMHNRNASCLYIKPNAASYTTVIDGWLSSDDDDAAQNAQSLLDKMEKMYDETGDESIRPNTVSYMLVCQAWTDNHNDRKTGMSAERAEQILERMKDRGMTPNVKVYTAVLNSWCRVSGKIRGAMQHVERLLTEMEHLSTTESIGSRDDESDQPMACCDLATGNDPGGAQFRSLKSDFFRPNVITYTSVISGYARSNEPGVAAKAESVLKRMVRSGVEPDMVSYTAVLNAWAKTKNYEERTVAAKRSINIVTRMEEQYIKEKYHLKPNLITYATCISAIGNSLDPNAAELAEGILQRMYDLHEEGTIAGLKPTTATYNSVITAFARSKKGNGRKNAQRAESLLVEMTRRSQKDEPDVQPNVRTWSGVMNAWAFSGERAAAINSQRVLDNLEQLFDLDQTTVRPNCVCFTTVMGAWSTSRRPDSIDRAEKLLWRMEKQFLETGDKDSRPNAITYVTLINAFIKSDNKNAGQRAQKTVDRMMRLYLEDKGFNKPSRMVFNALINAWSRSDDKGAARQAEKILQWMERQYMDGDDYFKPDDVTFCGVLNAWANHAKGGGAHRAQQILDHMEELTTQERGFQQSIVGYNIAIKAWARSGEPDAVQHAENILQRLEGRSQANPNELRPDTMTYSSVLNSCAYYAGPPEGRDEAFSVAMRTFGKLCNSKTDKPNHVTYGTLLKAISTLTPMDAHREALVRPIFERCKEDGQVDFFVLSQLRGLSTTQAYRRLLEISPGEELSSEEIRVTLAKRLPKQWSVNVPQYHYNS